MEEKPTDVKVIVGEGDDATEFYTVTPAPVDEEEDIYELTLRQKLARIRLEFSEMHISKSGVNRYAGFRFFELGDIVPPALKLFRKYEVLLEFEMTKDTVTGCLYDNCKKGEHPLIFSFPKKDLDISKTKMNDVQGVGSEITYYRRYIYAIVLDVADNDDIDSGDTQEHPKPSRFEAKAQLTNTDVPASELQIDGLKKALKALREKDPSYEEYIKVIAVKTQKFTKITKQECEDYIIKIGEILNDNNNVGEQTSEATNTDSKAKEDNRD